MSKQKNEGGAAVADKPRKFRVHLAASTPLASPTAEFEAESADEAWAKFCELNGISGSSCERTITEV